ncbi:MAG: DUF5131 family protein [Actinomycetota bacterium]|nr:DUF5131 family protein [Actinomycetota bacterium]
MSTRTGIEWTEATRNPTTGCDRTSPGCDHCYAMTLAKRLKLTFRMWRGAFTSPSLRLVRRGGSRPRPASPEAP